MRPGQYVLINSKFQPSENGDSDQNATDCEDFETDSESNGSGSADFDNQDAANILPCSTKSILSPKSGIIHTNHLIDELGRLTGPCVERNDSSELEHQHKKRKINESSEPFGEIQQDLESAAQSDNEQGEQQHQSVLPMQSLNGIEVNHEQMRNHIAKKRQKNQSKKENQPKLSPIEIPPIHTLPFIFQPQFFEVVSVSEIEGAAKNDFHIAARCIHCVKLVGASKSSSHQHKMYQKLIRGTKSILGGGFPEK